MPFIKTMGISPEIGLLIAFTIGIGFGFFLERGGLGNSHKLAMQFYFRDLTVFKVMFTSIITAMTGLIYFRAWGWLNFDLVYLNPTYLWSGIVGGVVMGMGFILGGYCPGTSVIAASTLKIDAIFFIGGALLGMVVFSEIYPLISGFMQSGFLGNRAMLSDFMGVKPGIVGAGVIAIALLGFWGAEWAEKFFAQKEETIE